MELTVFKPENNKNITTSLETLFSEYDEKINMMKELAESSSDYAEVISYFLEANELRSSYSNLFNFEKAKSVLNSEMWTKAIKKTNVLKYMPAEDRNKWDEDIREYKTPDFKREVVLSTIENLLLSQNTFFAKKVDGIFKNLSGEHVTNSPNGFNKKMIISNVIDNLQMANYEKAAFIDDLRFCISKIIGIQNNDFNNKRTVDDIRNIIQHEEYGKWFTFDGGLFRLKLFKKGTAHMEVFPSIAIKLNQVLSQLHPMAIPSKHKTINKKIKEFKLEKDFLSSDVLDSLNDIIERTRRSNSCLFMPNLRKESLDKVKEIIQLVDGRFVDNYLTFSYNPSSVLMEIKMKGYIPERKSHQFYPTEESLAELCISMIRLEKWDRILEPSAGNGSLVDQIPQWFSRSRITCLDISKTQCSVLKEKGYNAECLDFMKYSNENKFSKIIMNPPFTKNQAKDHVEKALEHLDDSGKLIAIVPSSLRDKVNYDESLYKLSYTEDIKDAFLESNTKVSVCLVKATRI